jgi:hypothetical protein
MTTWCFYISYGGLLHGLCTLCACHHELQLCTLLQFSLFAFLLKRPFPGSVYAFLLVFISFRRLYFVRLALLSALPTNAELRKADYLMSCCSCLRPLRTISVGIHALGTPLPAIFSAICTIHGHVPPHCASIPFTASVQTYLPVEYP